MLLNLQLIKEGEKPSIQMARSTSKKARGGDLTELLLSKLPSSP